MQSDTVPVQQPSAKALGKRKMVEPPPSQMPHGLFPPPAAEPPWTPPPRPPPDTSQDAELAAAIQAELDEEARQLREQQRQYQQQQQQQSDADWLRTADLCNLFGDEGEEAELLELNDQQTGYDTDEIDPDNPYGYANTDDPDEIRAQTDRLNRLLDVLDAESGPPVVMDSNLGSAPSTSQAFAPVRRYVGPIKIDPDDLD